MCAQGGGHAAVHVHSSACLHAKQQTQNATRAMLHAAQRSVVVVTGSPDISSPWLGCSTTVLTAARLSYVRCEVPGARRSQMRTVPSSPPAATTPPACMHASTWVSRHQPLLHAASACAGRHASSPPPERLDNKGFPQPVAQVDRFAIQKASAAEHSCATCVALQGLGPHNQDVTWGC